MITSTDIEIRQAGQGLLYVWTPAYRPLRRPKYTIQNSKGRWLLHQHADGFGVFWTGDRDFAALIHKPLELREAVACYIAQRERGFS